MTKQELINHILHDAAINSNQDLSEKLNGLSKGEIGLLGYLAFIEDNVSAGALSEQLKITSARVARLLNTLEKKSYVIRIKDTKDRRKILVQITKEGNSLIAKIHNDLYNMISYIIDEIGMEDTLAYFRITNKIKDALNKMEGGSICCR